MNDFSYSERMQAQIESAMRDRETAELIDIWQKHDQDEWREEALEAVREILIERLGRLPDPVGADDFRNIAPIQFPTDQKIIWVAVTANNLSWIVAFVALASISFQLFNTFIVTAGVQRTFLEILMIFLNVFDGIVNAGFLFLALQAFKEIIYLLMDIRDLLLEPDDEETDA